MPDKYCWHCGTALAPEDRFCRNCGTPAASPPAIRPAPRRFSFVNLAALAAVGFCLLALAMLAVYALLWSPRTSAQPFVAYRVQPTATLYPTQKPYPTANPYRVSTPYPLQDFYPITGLLFTATPDLPPNTFSFTVGPRDDNCELAATNSFDVDAVLVLVSRDTDDVAMAVYLRAHSSLDQSGLTPGTYDEYVALGRDWDSKTGRFLNNAFYAQVKDPVVFTSCESPWTGSGYQTLTVTFGGVEGPGINTTPLAPEDFPQVSP